MELSKDFKNRIVDEFKFIIAQMKGSTTIMEANYYYSATYGIINRVLNFEFHRHLQFIHFILNTSHQTIVQRINMKSSGDATVPINLDFFLKLVTLLEELTEKIEKEEHGYEILEKISALTYTLTGNGYYLQKRGIKIIDF